jgi:hypothetical protein
MYMATKKGSGEKDGIQLYKLYVEVIGEKLQTASREFTTRVHDVPRQRWGISWCLIKVNPNHVSIFLKFITYHVIRYLKCLCIKILIINTKHQSINIKILKSKFEYIKSVLALNLVHVF